MHIMSRRAGNISQRVLYADMLLHEKHFTVHSKAQVITIISLTSYGIKLIQDGHLKKDHHPPFDPIENPSIPSPC